jgi:hypothetical protein
VIVINDGIAHHHIRGTADPNPGAIVVDVQASEHYMMRAWPHEHRLGETATEVKPLDYNVGHIAADIECRQALHRSRTAHHGTRQAAKDNRSTLLSRTVEPHRVAVRAGLHNHQVSWSHLRCGMADGAPGLRSAAGMLIGAADRDVVDSTSRNRTRSACRQRDKAANERESADVPAHRCRVPVSQIGPTAPCTLPAPLTSARPRDYGPRDRSCVNRSSNGHAESRLEP